MNFTLQYLTSLLKMTLREKNDNDNLEGYQLTPADRHIYEWAKLRPDQPFCYLDFKDKFAHGTIRNSFSKLKKFRLIRLYCRSSVAFYIPSSSKLKKPTEPITLTRMVGGGGVRGVRVSLGAFLDSLDWEDVCRVHNVVLSSSVERLYDLLLKDGIVNPIKGSRDIKFGSFKWSRGRELKVVLHCNGKVTSYLKCSHCPIEVSISSLVSLSSFLGGIRHSLVQAAVSIDPRFSGEFVPDVSNWIVVQWHYGKDSKQEISGPAFNVTFRTWCNELARIYMHHCGEFNKARLEVLQKPKKPLPEAFAEKLDPNYRRRLQGC